MENIIPAVDPLLVEEELHTQRCLTQLSRGSVELYLVEGYKAPSVMREIGRLREIAFRAGGGGTGKDCDTDRFDLDPTLGFRQLVCWDGEAKEIMGGYRYLCGRDIKFDAAGQPDMPSAHLFHFSEPFIQESMPTMMELSRSFIVDKHQRGSVDLRRNVFTLDHLFTGLSYLFGSEKQQTVFGKVTFYPSYPKEAFAMLDAFFGKYCLNTTDIIPHKAYKVPAWADADKVMVHNDYRADLHAVQAALRQGGYYMPPILSSYLKIFQTVTTYGAAVNDEFGDVMEMGLLVRVNELLPERYTQYL